MFSIPASNRTERLEVIEATGFEPAVPQPGLHRSLGVRLGHRWRTLGQVEAGALHPAPKAGWRKRRKRPAKFHSRGATQSPPPMTGTSARNPVDSSASAAASAARSVIARSSLARCARSAIRAAFHCEIQTRCFWSVGMTRLSPIPDSPTTHSRCDPALPVEHHVLPGVPNANLQDFTPPITPSVVR